MSETTHTPGPWRTGRKVFRTIYCEEHGTEGRLIGVMDRREDATLVAAAPEMLAALAALCDAVVGCEIPKRASLLSALDAARAVLAKAEGRER
jgi:hypothetical protein